MYFPLQQTQCFLLQQNWHFIWHQNQCVHFPLQQKQYFPLQQTQDFSSQQTQYFLHSRPSSSLHSRPSSSLHGRPSSSLYSRISISLCSRPRLDRSSAGGGRRVSPAHSSQQGTTETSQEAGGSAPSPSRADGGDTGRGARWLLQTGRGRCHQHACHSHSSQGHYQEQVTALLGCNCKWRLHLITSSRLQSGTL